MGVIASVFIGDAPRAAIEPFKDGVIALEGFQKRPCRKRVDVAIFFSDAQIVDVPAIVGDAAGRLQAEAQANHVGGVAGEVDLDALPRQLHRHIVVAATANQLAPYPRPRLAVIS